jgi:tight adherence protein B
VTAAGLALGEPTEVALERLRGRARSRAWDTLVAALMLQREAGGDLAGLLRRLAAALEAALERRRTPARPPPRRAAPPISSRRCPRPARARRAREPGFLASLVANPLSACSPARAGPAGTALVVIAARARRRDARAEGDGS